MVTQVNGGQNYNDSVRWWSRVLGRRYERGTATERVVPRRFSGRTTQLRCSVER